MNYLLLTLLLLPFTLLAGNITLDPTQPDQDTLTISCQYPVERTDGTTLAINEIAVVTFHVKNQGESDVLFVDAGQNTTACRQVYDLSSVPDGVYIYAMKARDTDGRESIYSTGRTVATVKRIANPNSPSGITETAS